MIHIFRAKDGKWTYCPGAVKNWPAFSCEGQFETRDQAVQAVQNDPTCRGVEVRVEAGFLEWVRR